MKAPRFALALALFVSSLALARAADSDLRFSKTLRPAELSATGLDRLSSDQLAILDALIRRDIAQSRYTSKEPRAERFSARLTDAERDQSGLAQLAETELAALDAHIAPLATPPASGGRFTPNTRYASIPSVKIDRGPRIHGQLTLMVAAGSDDYTAYGGGIAVTVDDPASRMSLTLAYSEIHSKGGGPWRYCGDYYYGRRHGPFAPLY
jgi:hypothetical protein